MRPLWFILFMQVICMVAVSQQPNVVFILTDDQGYGDLACHGNPWIQTPNLDSLHAHSIRYTNYHVGTTCAPTRAGIITGKYSNKVGVWHTLRGREILRKNEVTMADIFKQAGYATAIFGKWHLGDQYPFRPQDRGFDEVLVHQAGGVGQTPDHWNNKYFDDTYLYNGVAKQFKGYCTDIWFEQAERFMREKRGTPFFCYIATNSPHEPTFVDQQYIAPYANNPEIPSPAFYGMITNIDERIGKLISFLRREGLYENTIVIFMTDNGTADGARTDPKGNLLKGFNAGMRGRKVSPYEGGHRVPFFLHWPAGNLDKPRDITALTSYVDVLPTLIDLCGIKSNVRFDGISTRPLFRNDTTAFLHRVIYSDTQRGERLEHGKNASVMKDQWRLVFGKELYDVQSDPGQQQNVADKYPEIVTELTQAYEVWWKDVSQHAAEYAQVVVGSKKQPVTCLTTHDLHVSGAKEPAWHQIAVRKGEGPNGYWMVDVAKAGSYLIELRRYPVESGLALGASAPPTDSVPGAPVYPAGLAIRIKEAGLQLGHRKFRQPVNHTQQAIVFEQHLEKGPLKIATEMIDEAGVIRPAYYVYIKEKGSL